MPARLTEAGRARAFWSRTRFVDGHILYTGGLSNGWGVVTLPRVNGVKRSTTAHRVAWEYSKGPIPRGKSVLHSCRERACLLHLKLGTQRENVLDQVRDGTHHLSRFGYQTGRKRRLTLS